MELGALDEFRSHLTQNTLSKLRHDAENTYGKKELITVDPGLILGLLHHLEILSKGSAPCIFTNRR